MAMAAPSEHVCTPSTPLSPVLNWPDSMEEDNEHEHGIQVKKEDGQWKQPKTPKTPQVPRLARKDFDPDDVSDPSSTDSSDSEEEEEDE